MSARLRLSETCRLAELPPGWTDKVLSSVAAALSSGPPVLPGFLAPLDSPLAHYGLWAIALFVFLEDFGIPVPGETVLIAGAVFAGSGRLNIVAVGVVGFLAAVAGDNIGYAIGRFGGRALVERWGRYVFLTEERLDKAERFFTRHGGKIIVVARFIEGLRQANGIIAGIIGMRWLKFLACNALGAALWVGTWVSVGYFAGQHITAIYNALTEYSLYAAIVAVVVIAAWIVLHLRKRRRRPGRPAAAGTGPTAAETGPAKTARQAGGKADDARGHRGGERIGRRPGGPAGQGRPAGVRSPGSGLGRVREVVAVGGDQDSARAARLAARAAVGSGVGARAVQASAADLIAGVSACFGAACFGAARGTVEGVIAAVALPPDGAVAAGQRAQALPPVPARRPVGRGRRIRRERVRLRLRPRFRGEPGDVQHPEAPGGQRLCPVLGQLEGAGPPVRSGGVRGGARAGDLAVGGLLAERVAGQGGERRPLQDRQGLAGRADHGRLARGDRRADQGGVDVAGISRTRSGLGVDVKRRLLPHRVAGELRQPAQGFRAARRRRADQPEAG